MTLTCSHVEHRSAQGAADPHIYLGILLHTLLHVLRLPLAKENLNPAVNLQHSRHKKQEKQIKKKNDRFTSIGLEYVGFIVGGKTY